MRLRTTSFASALVLAACGGAQAATLHALTSDGTLLAIDSEQRKAAPGKKVGTDAGKVLAIAVRPADAKLYGLTSSNQIVTIDPQTGRVTPGAKLDKPLETGARVTINFNPVVDRLRVIGGDGTNYRIHPDTGAVTADGALRYDAASSFAGTTPRVTAAAYTNHVAGTKETALYTIDPMLGQINLQAPPNDGVQQPKAGLGTGLPNGIGFDILADGQGGNVGYVVAGGKLWSMAFPAVSVREMGMIAGAPSAEIVSIAATK